MELAAGTETQARRAHLRASAILVGILLCLLEGCPVPRMNPGHLDEPQNRADLERWSEALGSVGIDIDADRLGREVVAVSERLGRAHATAVAPFRPAFDLFGLRERFVLFPIAKRRFLWLEVEAARAGERYRLVYRPGDPEHPAPFPELEYRRIRALLTAGSHGPNAELPHVATYVADRLFARDAAISRVRVGYAWAEIVGPGGAIRAEPRLAYAVEKARRR